MTKSKTKKPTPKPRNRPAISSRAVSEKVYESDGTYLLKLVAFVLLGTLWLKFSQPITWFGMQMNGIPLGLLIGVLLVSKFEKYQSDRKIWYAILIIVTIICYFAPAGILI